MDLLETAYQTLGYSADEGGSLLSPREKPEGLSIGNWVEKGDWLCLAERVGADRVFFVENNPVVVFSRIDDASVDAIYRAYSRAWSLARPRILFLATRDQIRVFDLRVKPVRGEVGHASLSPLAIAATVIEIAANLERFSRDNIESGILFTGESRFNSNNDSADRAIIRDLKAVRASLIERGLGGADVRHAHSLIGRSIFIRYLEERRVLTREYFEVVAKKNKDWKDILKDPPSRPGLDLSEAQPLYPRILGSKPFTYALFQKLSDDFNGDMFPDVAAEEALIKDEHLALIQDLLYGDTGPQHSLFFEAYHFDVIPIELISSIYEEFYSGENKKKKNATYYTPPSLVEFVLQQSLDQKILSKNPRILDPACGSGIFLVDAFRRIVRYRTAKQGRRLGFNELKKIIKEQLFGIDLNREAIRVAAFSLNLSLLHYLHPEEIREEVVSNAKLPTLTIKEAGSEGTLLCSNAFSPSVASDKRFTSKSFDLVIGNPPWGTPDTASVEERRELKVMMQWCLDHDAVIGYKERSQGFLWRALDFLTEGGRAALLVSAGVLFKNQDLSTEFRRKFFSRVSIRSVYNFTHIRQVFFSGGVSPFLAFLFDADLMQAKSFEYWSAKRTALIEGLQVVKLNRTDLKILSHLDDLSSHELWKTLWWGTHRDNRLIRQLQAFPRLSEFVVREHCGEGYKKANEKQDSAWLADYPVLPIESFSRYGRIASKDYSGTPPDKVECLGVREVYEGPRLIIKRGIESRGEIRGRIIARYDKATFCFTHSLIGVKLKTKDDTSYKVMLGILWSSVARYYLFLTTAGWGIWHDEIRVDLELLGLPVAIPDDPKNTERIVEVVDALRGYNGPSDDPNLRQLEARLDDAIFRAYRLEPDEIDLIREMCDIHLDYFYKRNKSDAIRSLSGDKPWQRNAKLHYGTSFIKHWQALSGATDDLTADFIFSEPFPSLVAVLFRPDKRARSLEAGSRANWATVLKSLEKVLTKKESTRVFMQRSVCAVTDDWLMLIKPNEWRLWTKGAARDDAESCLLQAISAAKRAN